ARDVARLPPGPEVGGPGEGESPLAAAGERRTHDRLRPLEAQLELSEHAAEDGERRTIVAPHERGDLGDAGHAGVGDELLDERRADAAPRARVGRSAPPARASSAGAPDRRGGASPPAGGPPRRRPPGGGCFAWPGGRRRGSSPPSGGWEPLNRARLESSPSRSKSAWTV